MFKKKNVNANSLPTYNTTKTTCPVCGMVVCLVTGIRNASPQGPKAGDGLICANCCSVLQFTAEGSLKCFSRTDYEALSAQEKCIFNEWIQASMELIIQDLKSDPPPPYEVC